MIRLQGGKTFHIRCQYEQPSDVVNLDSFTVEDITNNVLAGLNKNFTTPIFTPSNFNPLRILYTMFEYKGTTEVWVFVEFGLSYKLVEDFSKFNDHVDHASIDSFDTVDQMNQLKQLMSTGKTAIQAYNSIPKEKRLIHAEYGSDGRPELGVVHYYDAYLNNRFVL